MSLISYLQREEAHADAAKHAQAAYEDKLAELLDLGVDADEAHAQAEEAAQDAYEAAGDQVCDQRREERHFRGEDK